jgi:hypothetical protein
MTDADIRAEPSSAEACDNDRFAAIEELADQAASFWRSIAEAAFRGDRLTVTVHCRQVALVTRAAFSVAKSLGAEDRQNARAA